MIEAFIHKLNIPDNCKLNKPVFKKLFLEKGKLDATDKKALKDDIDKIRWLYTLKPSTINIASYMQLNSEDGVTRHHISVQLPEAIDEKSEAYKAGYTNIADISKERIRRAAKKIKQENPDYDGDLGFKTFKLDSSNIKSWDADFDTLEEDLLGAVDYIKENRSSEDILYELLLKYGLDLTVPIETRTIAGKTVYSIGLGALIVCLDKDITIEVVNGIGALKEELQPEIMRVVFKDESFKDDVVKTNALQR